MLRDSIRGGGFGVYIQQPYLEIDPVRVSIAEQHTAIIIHNLLIGRPVDAIAAVERCRNELEDMSKPLSRGTYLQDLFARRNDCEKSLNTLEEHLGAWTLGDLLDLTPHSISDIPNLGIIQVIELLQALIYRLPVGGRYGDD